MPGYPCRVKVVAEDNIKPAVESGKLDMSKEHIISEHPEVIKEAF